MTKIDKDFYVSNETYEELRVIDAAAREHVEREVERLEDYGADPPTQEHRNNMRGLFIRKLGEWSTAVKQSEQGAE